MKITDLKEKVFGVPQYNECVLNFKGFMQGLTSREKKLLRSSRHNQMYFRMDQCFRIPQGTPKTEDETASCLKESLHRECESNFKSFDHCLRERRGRSECNLKLGEYFVCVDSSIKQIQLSSTMFF